MGHIKPQNIGALVNNFAAMDEYYQQQDYKKLERLLGDYLDSLPIGLSTTSKTSLIERIMDTILDGNFYAAINSNYNSVNLLNTSLLSYNIYLCAEPKIFLFNFKKRGAAYSLYLGLSNEDLIVKTAANKNYGTTKNISIANYAYGDHKRLRYAANPSENRLENSVECDRFDPIRVTVKDDHRNDDKMNFITNEEELALYKTYYRDTAKCPHFHVFPVKLMASKPYSNSKSLAIELADLRRYVHDLDNVKDKNSPLLKYDLSMPYLLIKTNQIDINIDNFLNVVEKILDKYSKTNNKDACIQELYDKIYSLKLELPSKSSLKPSSLTNVYNALTIMEALNTILPVKDQLRVANSYFDCINYSNTIQNTDNMHPEEMNR